MKHQDFKLCRTHSRAVPEGDECPACCAERSLLVRCETHDETFETECPACAVWKANTLDQDAQEVVAAPPAPMLRRESDREYLGNMPTPKASGNLGDGWVEWHGGECPLPQMAQIEYKMRTATKTYRHNAGSLGWNHTGTGGDIVAYKVVDEPQTAPNEPQSGGVKFDQGKPPVSLVDRHAIEQIANVLAFGAKKYAAHNWRQGINYSRLLDAALRHLFAFADGEDNDPESGLSHIAHAGCCVVFLLGMMNTRPDLDDRFKATT